MAGYNEERIVIEAVSQVQKALEAHFEDYEIVLVDDGSKDNTLALMRRCAEKDPHIRVIENGINLNYGSGVLRGLKFSTKKWVVYDAFDLEMDPLDFIELFNSTDRNVDVVVYQRETYEAVFWRKFASLLNTAILNILFPMLMRGTPTLQHTMMFRRSCLDGIIPLSRSPIFFSAELVFRAKLKKLNWVNQKIRFNSIDGVRKGAFGHLYDILWALIDMFRFRFLLWGGKVDKK